MNRSGMKCVLYPRVSTEMQVDGFSLDGQITNLRRFADREEMIIINTYEDAGSLENLMRVGLPSKDAV